MSFLYPVFLFALLAVAIPVIIHLFNFRRYKTIYFSNLRFLKNIKQETKSRSEIKQLLILLSRILTVACLVFAFAHPYIPLAQNLKITSNELVSIYIDNSFSMDAESKYGKLLEVAKNKARDIADAFPAGTNFILITNDFEGKHQHKINKEQLLENIADVKISPVVRPMSEIVQHQLNFVDVDNQKPKSDNRQTLFIISDFQKTTTDVQNIKNDSTLKIEFLPLATQHTNNLYIDSCWFESPSRKLNQAETFFVKVVNRSNESYQNIPLKVFINDSLKSISSFNILEGASETVHLSFSNSEKGIIFGRAEITDYPITYDNTYFFGYKMEDSLRVLSINETKDNIYLDALFKNDLYIKLFYATKDNIKTSQFSNYKIIILNELKNISSGLVEELTNYVAKGGTLAFFPNLKGDINAYNDLFKSMQISTFIQLDSTKTSIKNINYKSELYNNVFKKIDNEADMPVILKHFESSNQLKKNDISILSTEKNQNILSMSNFKKGKVYVYTIPLNNAAGNFAKHALFIPTVYNMCLFTQVTPRIYYIIGRDENIEFPNFQFSDNNMFHITDQKGKFDFIPQHSTSIINSGLMLNMAHNITVAGNYFVKSKQEIVAGLSFNYDRRESDMEYYSDSEIKNLINKQNLTNSNYIDGASKYLLKTLKQINQGRQLWKLFIILALIFIAAEIALVKLWK